MRILHVIASLDPARGGPPMIAARLAAGQTSLGHDVHIATLEDPRRRDVVACALDGIPDYPGVRVHNVGTLGTVKTLLARTTRTKLKCLISEADVSHLHGVWDPLLLVAGAECRRRRCPYFVLLNGMLDPWSLGARGTPSGPHVTRSSRAGRSSSCPAPWASRSAEVRMR